MSFLTAPLMLFSNSQGGKDFPHHVFSWWGVPRRCECSYSGSHLLFSFFKAPSLNSASSSKAGCIHPAEYLVSKEALVFLLFGTQCSTCFIILLQQALCSSLRCSACIRKEESSRLNETLSFYVCGWSEAELSDECRMQHHPSHLRNSRAHSVAAPTPPLLKTTI